MKLLNKLISVFLCVLLGAFVLSFSSYAAVRPLKPSQLKATSVEADSVSLTWKKSLSADFYRVYIKKDGKWKALEDLQERSCKIEGLTASKSYTFAVRSVNQSGGKNYYSKDYATVKVKTKALSKTTLSATAGVDYIKLKWKKVAGATGYNVYRKVSGEWKFIEKLSADKLYYTVKQLKYDTAYQFAVRPFTTADGEKLRGPISNTVRIKTLRANKVTVKAVSSTENTVTLKWTKAADATGYRIYRYVDGKWKTVTTVKSRETLSAVVSSLKSDKKHRFRVRAFSASPSDTVWFVPSASCTGTTDPTAKDLTLNRTKKLKETLNAKCFTLSYVTENKKYGKVPVSISKRGEKYRLYSRVNEFDYTLLNISKADYIILGSKKAYMKVPSSLSDTTDVKAAVDALLPGKTWKGKATLATFDGKKAVCETYINTFKTKSVKYYYRAGELVGLEEYGSGGKLVERAYVTALKNTASASLFKVPDGYKRISSSSKAG